MFTKTEKTKDLRKKSESSFTLIETVIALSLVAFLIVEVAAVQGNSIVFSDYGRNLTQATYLAQRVMSQVEYFWRNRSFKELETNTQDGRFEDNPEYQYTVEIKEWKFPFLQLLQGALGGGGGDGEEGGESQPGGAAAGAGNMLDTVIDQIFGKEPIFMTAHVEVSWAEGAARNSTGLTYLLTNQAKLDEAILQLKPVWERLTKPAAVKNDKKLPPGSPGNPAGNPSVNPGENPPNPEVPPPPPIDDGG